MTDRKSALVRAAALVLVGVVVASACGALGWWQWQRAHDRATVAQPEPAVPIELRYGRDRAPAPSRDCLGEEPVGYPGAIPLPD